MKQKTRFKNFGSIGIDYWSMNGWCISIGPKKPHQSISTNYVYHQVWCQDVSSYCVLILGDDQLKLKNWDLAVFKPYS